MLKPLGDRVVLKVEEKEQTVGGFVPRRFQTKKNQNSSSCGYWTRCSYLER